MLSFSFLVLDRAYNLWMRIFLFLNFRLSNFPLDGLDKFRQLTGIVTGSREFRRMPVDKAMFVAIMETRLELATLRIAHLEELLPILKENAQLLADIVRRAEDDDLADIDMIEILAFYHDRRGKDQPI